MNGSDGGRRSQQTVDSCWLSIVIVVKIVLVVMYMIAYRVSQHAITLDTNLNVKFCGYELLVGILPVHVSVGIIGRVKLAPVKVFVVPS